MKKDYIKPSIQVVMLQQQYIICTSPGDLDNQNLGMPGGQIGNEGDVI